MRILVLTKRRASGRDFENDRYGRAFQLASGLANLGNHVSAIAVGYRGEPEHGPQCLHSNGASISTTAITIKWLHPWSAFRAIWARLRAINPDAIWCSGDALQVITGLHLGHRAGIPVVSDLYDNYEAFWPTRIPGIHAAFRHAVRVSEGVTCVSDPLARKVQKEYRPLHAPTVLENGATPEFFDAISKSEARRKLNLPMNATLIGSAGSLRRKSGIDTLIHGFRYIQRDLPNVVLVLAGPLDPGVELPGGKGIRYLGKLPYDLMPAFYRSLDLGVICNRNTRFGRYCYPLKLPEIGAAGIPFIAPRLPVLGQIFWNHPQMLYEPENPMDLAAVLRAQLVYGQSTPYEVPRWDRLSEELEDFLARATKGRNVK